MSIRVLLFWSLLLLLLTSCSDLPIPPGTITPQEKVVRENEVNSEAKHQLEALSPIIYVSLKNSQRSLHYFAPGKLSSQVLTPETMDSYSPQISPDKKNVAFVVKKEGSSDIYIQNLETNTINQLTHHPSNDYHPKWSPNGKMIAFLSDRSKSTKIWIAHIETGETEAFSEGPANHFDIDWSWDGKYLAYSSDQSGIPQLVIADVESRHHRVISQERRANFLPKWRPGSHDISYISLLGTAELRLQALNDNQESILSTFSTGGQVISYAWSPDGTKIALPHSCSKELCLSVHDYQEKKLTQQTVLQSSATSYASPEWSESSRYLVYTAIRENFSHLFVYDLETQQETQLTEKGHNYSADWSLSQFSGGVEQRSFLSLKDLQEQKSSILNNLIQPIHLCVGQKDTDHAAFSGCIDWHSSVHGIWALTKYTQLTGDKRYVALIEKQLSPENLQIEASLLKTNPHFEMPYGRAWFLRLALDYRTTFQSNKLDELAEYVAKSLYEYYRHRPSSPFSTSYNNDSWALLNLYDYANSQENREIAALVYFHFTHHYSHAPQCTVTYEEDRWADFMPICTTAVLLATRVLPTNELSGWLTKFYQASDQMQPVLYPRRAHHFGVNFSRSWGLWSLYEKTKKNQYLDDYLAHVSVAYFNEKHWKYDYRQISHWVAQFGIFAFANAFMSQVPKAT